MADKSTNLSKIEREQMIATLDGLKAQHPEKLEAINQVISFIKSKKYGLNFEKHVEQVDIDLENHVPVFKPFKQIDAGNPDDGYNFLLEGDNLHSLKLLEKTHKGRIDVIYIDPPYNTLKDDFVYGDKMLSEDDGFIHSKWLSFMSERLKIAKKLLTEQGVMFISIDDNEEAQLKLLCDDIFGSENFIANIINSGTAKNNSKYVSVQHEYALVYAKDLNSVTAGWMVKKNNVDEFEKRARLIEKKNLTDEEKCC